jgi:outer membrane receptor protein involved in Fe transport
MFQNTTYYGPDQLFYGFYPLTNGIVAIDYEGENTAGEKAFYAEVGFNFSKKSRFLLGYRRSGVESGVTFIKNGGFFPQLTGTDALVGQTFSTDEDVNTYKVGFEHTFNKDIFGYALVSSGYRPGGFNLPTAISPFSTYNSDDLYNYEMGLKTTWLNGRLRANASAYLLKYNDIQLNVQDPITYMRATKNVGKAQIYGVEFGINYLLSDYLQLGFSGSISNSELLEDVPPTIIDPNGDPNDPNNLVYTGRKGDKLPGSATENFALSVSYNKPISDHLNLLADVNYKYVGNRLNDFNTDLDVELGSYSLTNMRIGIDHKKGWSLALFADNVFDKAITYYIDRQGPTFESVPTNRPRTIGLNFSYNLK